MHPQLEFIQSQVKIDLEKSQTMSASDSSAFEFYIYIMNGAADEA